ncbi:endogenous retrovirus group K member 25 Pro protein-like protein [Turdus rufiventris]|nr:endogenous retrovirus group K member 25 Pro protein-like protein [Turdus rufiventris]
MIEAWAKKAELFCEPERKLGLANPKTAAAVTSGVKRQPMSPEQLQQSTGWTIIGVDLLDNSLDITINHTELDSKYFVTGDTAHILLEIEVAPMTITSFSWHASLSHPSIWPRIQAIPIPVEVPVYGKLSEVYWTEVVGEDKPSVACNLTCGSDHLHVKGLLDMGSDVKITPERMWPSHWELQHMAGKIQGVGGIKLAKISKSIM